MVNRRKAILETPKRRRRRRKRYVWIAAFYTVLFLIVASLIVGFFYIPFFRISDIAVSGTVEIDAEAVKSEARAVTSGNHALVIPRDNFFFYPKSKIEESIKNNFRDVSEVKVDRRGFHAADIAIKERAPHALYCLSTCFFIDSEGYAYKEGVEPYPADLVIFRDVRYAADLAMSSDNAEGATTTMNAEASTMAETHNPLDTFPIDAASFKGLESFASKVSTLNLDLIEVHIGKDGETVVKTRQGSVILSMKRPFDEQFGLLATALSQDVFNAGNGIVKNFNYIDLRFGNKVFYKIAPSDPVVESSEPVSPAATSTGTVITE